MENPLVSGDKVWAYAFRLACASGLLKPFGNIPKPQVVAMMIDDLIRRDYKVTVYPGFGTSRVVAEYGPCPVEAERASWYEAVAEVWVKAIERSDTEQR